MIAKDRPLNTDGPSKELITPTPETSITWTPGFAQQPAPRSF